MTLPATDITRITQLFSGDETWLLERLYLYASNRHYTKYSSTLVEAWRLSLAELNKVILSAANDPQDLELNPDADYQDDPACAFGILEARRHRARGVNLSMFLGLFKYYRQTYHDLLREKGEFSAPLEVANLVDRIFDRIEIAFCTEWSGTDSESQIRDLAGANRHLANQKNLFLTFFESLQHPSFLLDKQGLIQHMNCAAHQLMGRSNVPGAHYYSEVRNVEELPILAEKSREFISSGEVKFITEFWWDTPTGRVCFEAHLHRLQDISGKADGAALTLFDVTERETTQEDLSRTNADLQGALDDLKQAQDQVIQSEKMAAIGQLAAGVAHEINNPIGFVSSNVYQLAQYLQDLFKMIESYRKSLPEIADAEIRKNIQDLEEEIEIDFLAAETPALLQQTSEGLSRVARIVRDMKDFSRQSSGQWEFADLSALIENTLTVVWHHVKYKAEVVKNFADLPPVKCCPNLICQVVMNLVVNSAQSIADRGTIRISTGTRGDQVFIEVKDNGCGIPREIKNQIFNPFFTTKPVGEGTGLGLAVTLDIVQKHEGKIQVDSEPGLGTTFRVSWPLALEPDGDSPGESTDSRETNLLLTV